MALSGRAAALALLGVAVVLVLPSTATIVAIAVVLVCAIVADLLLAGGVRPLRFERSGVDRLRLGEAGSVTLLVRNPGRRAVRGTLRDAWPPSAGAAPAVVPVAVPPGEARRVTTVLHPTRRGDRRAARVTVRAYGPLRIAARQGSHLVPWAVRVLPEFASRRHLPEKLAGLRELEGRRMSLMRGQGSEFDSLREYVVGDDVRSIDWRATARRDDVMVRTWRPERARRVVLVLDTGRTSAGRVGDMPRLDASMDACLLLAALAARAGDRVDLLAYDRRVRALVRGTSRGDVLPAMVRAMAPLEPELVEADGAGMVAAILGAAKQRCLVVLCTDLNAPALGESLLPNLPALTARHLVVLCAVRDPRVVEMAAARGTAEAVYEAAAAQQALSARDRLTARLRREAVEVVDAPPDRVAPVLADTYLDLKSAGRL